MMNEFGQRIGASVPRWKRRNLPGEKTLNGRYCRLERINLEKHGDGLFNVYGPQSPLENWTYMPIDSFEDRDAFNAYFSGLEQRLASAIYAIISSETNEVIGSISLMRIDPDNGTIEVGYVVYSDALKRTRMATEVQWLLGNYVFNELGYRRFEWKCDVLNQPSYNAALRYGFVFEGIFRNALIYKGRTRDTAWFSIINDEWEALQKRYEVWLDPSNFDSQGQQIKRLSDC
ncbi:GNAT family N-acetyltransferase [Erysipelothrix sp. HDW6C]|uniref:GNAT family N-acetyltransferase n=1 Tax=Erysipelothrix sp. HDW6C TaxID=2714930 RepID=UPI00140A2872|nr:GNAT family protein [Erysipelothrix sp. HDW6C]QIK69584.1 GNAT family N-acetyltransferase [Erysipelothrix sp. HDW6C]